MVSVWYSLIFALVQFHFQSWHPRRVKLVLSKFLKVLLYYKKRIIAQIWILSLIGNLLHYLCLLSLSNFSDISWLDTRLIGERNQPEDRGITKWPVKQLTLDRWLEASTLVASIGYKDTSVGLCLWSITISTVPSRPGSL